MKRDFSATLWKIGASVVFTVPAKVSKEFELDKKSSLLMANLALQDGSFEILMKPWKCGGSVVITVPSPYVEGYGLNGYVKSKKEVNVILNKR